MSTEYHCHILPGIDDGAADPETSLRMAEMMQQQGVTRLIATPHFYAHRERSVARFLEKRAAAYGKIAGDLPFPEVLLGAEVAIEQGLSELKDIEKLAITGTDLILLELPYREYHGWMFEEIYNISAEFGLTVILAHVHRYLVHYTSAQLELMLKTKAIFQINNEAFRMMSHGERHFAKRLMKEQYPIVFGSDAHNTDDRAPNWDLLQKRVSAEQIAASDAVLDGHRRPEPGLAGCKSMPADKL